MTSASPWVVDQLEDFLYFCCPECNYRKQSEGEFLQHALQKHHNAKDHLQKFVKSKIESGGEIQIKEESSIFDDDTIINETAANDDKL